MTVRTDITVDYTVSPRIVEVASPSTSVIIQDLYDTLRTIENRFQNMDDSVLIDTVKTAGKQTLSPTKSVGITLTLNNAKLKFEDRGGPSYTIMSVTDGNLVAIDTSQDFVEPIEPSAFTTVKTEADVSAGLVQQVDIITIRKILQNRLETNPTTGIITIYDDDDSVLLTANLYEDVAASQEYRGQGADRRNRLE
jgi:hypothetical protein